MTNEQLIAKYNPLNAHSLSKADIEAMRKLTDAELKVLAEAYPATLNGKQYLVLYDNKVVEKKQLYNLSTWPKIYNLRRMNNLKNWVPFTFWDIFARPKLRAVERGINTSRPDAVKSARRVVDLSADEASRDLKSAIEENQKKETTTKKAAVPKIPAPPKAPTPPKKPAAPKAET